MVGKPQILSPTLKRVTPSPTASTVPAESPTKKNVYVIRNNNGQFSARFDAQEKYETKTPPAGFESVSQNPFVGLGRLELGIREPKCTRIGIFM